MEEPRTGRGGWSRRAVVLAAASLGLVLALVVTVGRPLAVVVLPGSVRTPPPRTPDLGEAASGDGWDYWTVEVVQQGSSAIVVDTLPIGLGAGAGDTGEAPDLTALAWRLRRAARLPTVHALASLGIPFVAWRGAGTLDEVLRDVSRMAAAPRIVR